MTASTKDLPTHPTDPIKLKMTIAEALEFADEWSKGLTLHEGAQSWRVVCMLLAEEVRRKNAPAGDYAALVERLRKDWDNGSTESLPDAIAALERLTQPVGEAEPFVTLHDDGYFTFKDRSRYDVANRAGWREDAYSAETVALLIAERDAAVAALDAKIDICGDARIRALQEQVKELMAALTFYAERKHFILADPDAWDTVSGEPQNLWEDEANTATVEDGSVARQALAATEPKEGEKS